MTTSSVFTEKAVAEPFAHLCRAVAAEIQDLKPEERFHRLHKLKLKWTSGLSTSLEQLPNESTRRSQPLWPHKDSTRHFTEFPTTALILHAVPQLPTDYRLATTSRL